MKTLQMIKELFKITFQKPKPNVETVTIDGVKVKVITDITGRESLTKIHRRIA